MLLRHFKRTGPLTIFLIVVILLSIWAGAFIRIRGQFSLYFDLNPMPLYGVVSTITGTHPFPGIVSSLFLVSMMAFLVVNLNTTLFFINERTFLPALFYILLSGLFPQYQLLNPAIIAAVFLMLAIRRIMQSYRIQGTAYNFFDAGLLIAAGSLFYANLIWFSFLLIIGISILRPLNLKEIVLSVLGLLTPYLLTAAFYYVAGKQVASFFESLGYNLFVKQEQFAFNPVIIAGLILAGLLTFFSLSHLFTLIYGKKIQSRKTFSILLWTFAISVTIFFLLPSVSIEIIWIAAIPVSYFLSHYFIFLKRKLLPEILFSLFLALILIIQLWHTG